MSDNYSHQRDQHYLVRVNKEVKCVCEMCSCGRHRCPKEQIKGDYQTSYGNHYQNYKVVPVVQQEQRKYNERHYNPEVLRTNYQETYIPVEAEQKVMTASRLGSFGRQILKSEPFVGATSYNSEFKPYKVEIQDESVSSSRLKLADSRERFPVKFEGESSYKSAFHQLPMPKIDRYKHPQYKSLAPFQGSSSYKNDFPAFRVEIAREENHAPSNQRQVRFEGSSSYKNDFGTFKVVPQEPPAVFSCKFDQIPVPSNNNLNDSKHIYYDQSRHRFV